MLVRWKTVIRLSGNQGAGYQDSRVSGKRIEDRGQKTEDKHEGISNPSTALRTGIEQGISNYEGGRRITKKCVEGAQDSAIPEPL